MGLHCWLFGHKVTGRIVKEGYLTSYGELVDGWRYYCACCLITNKYPNRRNVFQRSCILLWFRRWRNQRRFLSYQRK